MKQVILLEEHEVKKLTKGKQIEIVTPSGTLVIGFDKMVDTKPEQSLDERTCSICKKVFMNRHGLSVHLTRGHGRRKNEKAKKTTSL